jgi:polysaccharide pyruvyl transferase WcaK-like protein
MNELFETIKRKAEFILVRDHQSKRYLGGHYKIIVGPDLTFLSPMDVCAEVKEDVCGLNLRDWYFWKSELHGQYHHFMERIDNMGGRRFYPLAKWNPDEIAKRVKARFESVLPLPFYFEKKEGGSAPGRNNLIDVNVLSKYFSEVPSVFDPCQYQRIRYLMGMRYHSIVFAVQCGIPFLSLSYQPKNDTLCSDMGLGMLSTDIYNASECEKKIEYLKTHYKDIRDHMIDYGAKCQSEIQYIFRSLLNLISR